MVSKQLCLRPEVDNHWALRDFSSRLIAQICKNYHTTTNNCQTRVTRLFCRALANDKMPLASFYGALVGNFFILWGPNDFINFSILSNYRIIRIGNGSDQSLHYSENTGDRWTHRTLLGWNRAGQCRSDSSLPHQAIDDRMSSLEIFSSVSSYVLILIAESHGAYIESDAPTAW